MFCDLFHCHNEENIYNFGRFGLLCNFIVYQYKYLKGNFPKKAKFLRRKFPNVYYIMQNIFFEYLIHLSFINIKKNILMKKKDTWAMATFHEDCNLVFSWRFLPDTPYHYLNIAADVQRNLLILQENKSITK